MHGRVGNRISMAQASGDFRRTTYFFLPLIVAGVISALLHTHSRDAAATSFLWALSSFVSGAGLGFLFGVPKILQNSKSPSSTTDDKAISYQQQVNTNLTEISDWLTKIIVGVGLIQLKEFPSYINRLAVTLAASMGDPKDHQAFAQSLIVYFSIIGFLYGYLCTRLFLAGAFSRADQAAIAMRIRVLATELSPNLLKEYLLGIKPEALLEGEESFKAEKPSVDAAEASQGDIDETANTLDDRAELEAALKELKVR